MNIDELVDILKIKITELQILEQERRNTRIKSAQTKLKLERLNKCKAIVIEAGVNTQGELKEIIENIITTALQSVYGFKYKFVVQFTYDKRDQLEATFFIDKNGLLLEPRKDTIGYGVVDVCSFGLKMVIWVLQNSRTDPIMVFDEPFKNVGKAAIPFVSEMVKKISDMMGVQFIIATHIVEMVEKFWWRENDTVHIIEGE